MTPRIETLRSFIRAEKHHQFRRTPEELGLADLNEKFQSAGTPAVERSAQMLKALLDAECPIIIEGERIVATRTITRIPSIFTDAEWDGIRSKHTLHERGTVSNLSPDYEGIIADGLGKRKEQIVARLADENLTEEQKLFLAAARDSIEAVQEFILKYKACAEKAGLADVAKVLGAIHSEGAKTLHEALQLLRVVHFALCESDCYHNTLCRFDQYIYPYYKSDVES
jgi:formate C-acetyltransferase